MNALATNLDRKPRVLILVAVIGLVCLLLATVAFVGSLPVRGSIAVSQDQSDRFAKIMDENGIMFWTGIGGLGMMGVQFNNPFAIMAIDDLVIEDARKNKYKAIVRYECVIPYFDHVVTIN